MAASPALPGLLFVLTGSDTMINKNNVLILLLAVLLSGCGSDDDNTAPTVPTIPEGFGSTNNLENIRGIWHQDCSEIEGNLAKKQQITLTQRDIELTVWDYRDEGCTKLSAVNTFTGQYQLEPSSVFLDGDEVFPLEVIYVRSTSTPYAPAEVELRNTNRTCDRDDWQTDKEIDVSDWHSCFPLFDLQDRQHFRLVRNQAGRLFMDNRLKGVDANGYPKAIDTDWFDFQGTPD